MSSSACQEPSHRIVGEFVFKLQTHATASPTRADTKDPAAYSASIPCGGADPVRLIDESLPRVSEKDGENLSVPPAPRLLFGRRNKEVGDFVVVEYYAPLYTLTSDFRANCFLSGRFFQLKV